MDPSHAFRMTVKNVQDDVRVESFSGVLFCHSRVFFTVILGRFILSFSGLTRESMPYEPWIFGSSPKMTMIKTYEYDTRDCHSEGTE